MDELFSAYQWRIQGLNESFQIDCVQHKTNVKVANVHITISERNTKDFEKALGVGVSPRKVTAAVSLLCLVVG